MHSGTQNHVDFIARFSDRHPVVTLLRQVAYFFCAGAYLAGLTVMANLILGPQIRTPEAAIWMSIGVIALPLLATLIFYSTHHILAVRGLGWRMKQFFAGYALVCMIVLLLTATLWERPGTSALVALVGLVLGLILPSIRDVIAWVGKTGEPLLAALILLFAPSANTASTTLMRAAEKPYTLVKVQAIRTPRGMIYASSQLARQRPPLTDC